jgi:hypothetical protein
MRPLPFIGGTYLSRSRNFDCQRAINLFPEASGNGQSKSIAMLLGTPGLVIFAALAGGGVRGCIRFSATQAIVVVGGNVYSVSIAGVGTLIGTVVPRLTPVSMANNGITIMLVTGAEGYVITPNDAAPASGTVVQITNPAFTGSDRVDYMDEYFVFNKTGTQQFQITGLLANTIDPLDFASAEGSPDLLISLIVLQRELWLLGSNSTEIFFDSGNADFPFERIQGTFIEQGCAAKNSPAKLTDPSGASMAFWLTADDRGQGMAVKTAGYQAQRISTHAEEFAWAQYGRIDDAIGYTYQQEGHSFYMLTFPTANATWAYDTGTQLWHERAWRNPVTATLNRHRSNCQMAFAGKVIVGDWENGNLYSLSLDAYTDNGDILPAIRQAPHFASADNTWSIFDRFWVDIETGVGLPTGQGSDPQVMIEWSDDGGHTFPNQQWVSAGKIGEYRKRAVLRRCGKSRDRVWRVSITDPVKRVLIGAGANVRECSA